MPAEIRRMGTLSAGYVPETLHTVIEKDEKIIESESIIVLTPGESIRLMELIENPPPYNARFRKLMDDYQKWNMDGTDSTIEWLPASVENGC